MRQALAFIVLALLGTVLFAASAATAAPTPLTGTYTNADDFYPCPGQQPGQPPQLADCNRTTPLVTADCHPDGISTVTLERTGLVGGPNYPGGTYWETITVTIDEQTADPRPTFQPFDFSGVHVDSGGFKVGRILTWDDHFTMTLPGGVTVDGHKYLVNDLANTGVCKTLHDEESGSVFYGTAPLTGHVVILEAGVLSYTADITDGTGTYPDSGEAEAYLGDAYLTCCDSNSSSSVNAAMGHLVQRYGSTHPFEGTTSSGTIDTTDGTVTPAPGISLDFSSVGAGTVEVEAIEPTDVATIPAGYLAGDPPMFYNITTTASHTGLITVCVPYGPDPPAGQLPKLLHFENAAWKDISTSSDPVTRTVCGVTDSLSPFAAVFAPAAPQTKADCKKGGWKTYVNPTFKNEGDCASWVASKGKKKSKG